MLKPGYTKQFQKDLKRMEGQGKNIEKLKSIIIQLVNQKPLNEGHRDHKLIGNYRDRRECHIESDWLLIYKTTEEEIIFERTGSHSDLFK
ncbi:MAG: type II toxin-antitoxin system YafQ family toxin [bacterium]